MTPPVIFIHGLWVHSSAWEPWVQKFTKAGFNAAAIDWPGDSPTVAESRQHPERVAGIGIAEITAHYEREIAKLSERPIVVGHSFGGLVAQKLLSSRLAAAAVAIDPAPIKGVKALPLAQIRSALPVVKSKSNFTKAVSLKRGQFRYGFGNTLSKAESNELFDRFAIPGPGRPVFELTAAKKDANSPTIVDTAGRERGPLLIIGGEKDHTIPEVVARQAAALYAGGTRTEYRKIAARGHSLVFDSGWRTVADLTLEWIQRQVKA
ncbi:alpha/beta hydrolase [Gryllotalpicola protaetiae]|uniref:Alpha/beta fold hydrolase n=1 Tax=Gryllotalpicola protaetiae TaxID=2419771 RepID=A0A387BSK5_9MICO|nr:alpha/beta fold hydrolase [Gryllotalpicola protaetiae]AYG03917.1 alpha/beta fold hydrolase [Gryllotalpicola protaetiae]